MPADEQLLAPHLRADVRTVTFGDGGDVRCLGEVDLGPHERPEATEGAGEGAAAPLAATVGCSGVAIGPAGAGFFCASSATANSIARSIGIRAVPLFLSIQA